MGSKISTKLNIPWSRQKTPLEAHLGQILGPWWTKLGPSWAKLSYLGSNLWPTWAKLEPSWAKLGQVGAKLGLCWQILAGSWQSQRKVTPHVAENHQRWTQRAQHRPQNLDFGRVLGFRLAPKNQIKSDFHPKGAK